MAGYYDETTGEWVDTGDTGVTTGPLDNSSGTGTIGDYTNVQRFDDGSTLITDKDGNIIGSTPATDTTSTGGVDTGNLLARLGTSAFNALKSAFTNKDGSVNWKNVASAAGGLYGMYQSQQAQPKTGYQGGIPKYSAVREAVQGSHYDQGRRPGSGGQRYFSDLTYAAPGEAATAARASAKEQAAGLAALNLSNPAREGRPEATNIAAERGKESERVREGTAASEVSKTLPVPKYSHGGITALAQGRYLGGATDGMADKIPAQIDGKQEAKLSHGEFVIPADVVGHLGNGNSEAGAQRLYEMMDRIRKARTGSAKQGRQINPNKFLPT